ncbi:cobalamin biosynthesis protein [Streptomyces sp. S07_1.15]|uniref:cobalamin biosynthesis protein n=1 Tax=Streptomyces sp. S07_1.15 TaxID=2873925 RepID=UPI001D13298E|nr:cobalamin biosynthesis protein [Streptomyces sp. S07_1.15]MCC3654830.1 cobalamin biosynthesis protein [Streptomyces sp. S07_1.15]
MRSEDAAGAPAPRTPAPPAPAPPHSTDAVLVAGTALGFLADLLLADPRRGHPVAAFGRAATAAERLLWRDHRGAGALYTALCAGGTVAAAAGVSRAVRRSPAASGALTAAVTWAVLGGTSLGREARAVGAALEAGDLARARERLPGLCGRDPQSLDAQQIARAVVESVAENTSDAVVGALVWGAAAGVPGLAGFRAVNTLDAMAGHKSPRLRRFGWAPARLDDVAGFPGSRLTAALAVLAGPDPRGALRVLRSDARRHPSPNAGPVEAAFAGALGVRLGGTLAYGGRVEHRPVLGAGNRPVEPRDIERAVRLSHRVGALALVVCAGGRLAYGALRGGATAVPRPPAGPRGARPVSGRRRAAGEGRG